MTILLLGFAFGLSCLLAHLVTERRRLGVSGPFEQARRRQRPTCDADAVWADTA